MSQRAVSNKLDAVPVMRWLSIVLVSLCLTACGNSDDAVGSERSQTTSPRDTLKSVEKSVPPPSATGETLDEAAERATEKTRQD